MLIMWEHIELIFSGMNFFKCINCAAFYAHSFLIIIIQYSSGFWKEFKCNLNLTWKEVVFFFLNWECSRTIWKDNLKNATYLAGYKSENKYVPITAYQSRTDY